MTSTTHMASTTRSQENRFLLNDGSPLEVADAFAEPNVVGNAPLRDKISFSLSVVSSYFGVRSRTKRALRQSNERPKILLIVLGASWARDFLILAKALLATNRYEVEIGTNFGGPAGVSFKQKYLEIGIKGFSLDENEGSSSPRTASAPSRGKWYRAILKRVPFLRNILLIAYSVKQFHKDRVAAVRLISTHRPDVVVTCGYTGFHSAFLIKEAVRRHARVLRLDSYGVLAPAWRAVHRDRGLGKLVAVSTFWRGLLAAFFPGWTFKFADGRRIFYDSPDRCIAAALCGVMPARPFETGYGPISAFTAIHEYSRRALEAAGIERHRIHVIGRLQEDVAFALVAKAKDNKESCLEALGLDPKRPLIVCSSAPLVEHNQMTAEQQAQYHCCMISELASVPNAQVALSMHPGQKNTGEIYSIAERYGVKVFESPGINELLPLAALYADGESTVGVMAAAFGIPMIVVYLDKDVFPNGLPPTEQREALFQDYVSSLKAPDRIVTGGMVYMNGWKGVAGVAQRCLTDDAYHASLVERQRKSANLWAPAFDGMATERAVRLIGALCSQEH